MKKGWTWKPLGEVCKTGSGGTPLSSRKEYYEGGNIPWLLSGEVAQGNVRMAKNFITKEGLENSAARLFPKDTVLVAMYGATAGQVGILRFEAATNQAVCGILPNDQFVPEFLFYFLLAKRDELVAQATGNAQPNISQIKIKNTEVPIPSLAEQKQIVGLLDEAFAGIATAKANAEKNLQNARALFESHLQSIFTQRGPGWVEKRLSDLARINYGYTESASVEKVGPHFLRITDIQNNEVDWDTVPYCPIDVGDLPKYKLSDGDIVFARTGATTGKSYLVSNPPESVFASYLIRLQLRDKELLPQFVNLFFQTHSYWDVIRAGVSGSAQGGFNATKLGELVIPFPKSSKEQVLVVTKLEKLTTETQRLASLYERKLAALDELKKSLLHQAFTGELTKELPPPVSVQPLLPPIPKFTPIELHAGIIAMGYQAWEQAKRPGNFGHVMAEKFSHMTEAMVGLDLGRVPVKDHYGPDDFPHFQKVEHRARMANYFTFQDFTFQNGKKGKVLVKGRGFESLATKTRAALGELNQKVAAVIQLMLPLDLQQAEIFATTYAAWNNLLLDKQSPTDEQIVLAARENWHPDKLKIPRDKFFLAIGWMRKKGIIPQGNGKRVVARLNKK